MKRNMGVGDRTVRLLVAAIVVALYYFEVIHGILGIALLVISGIFVLTSFVSFCPLYTLFGISTCKVKKG